MDVDAIFYFFTEASRQQEVELAKTGRAVGSVSSGSESATKTAGSRANSKLIGEELCNEAKKHVNGNVSCHANNWVRMWPMFCHEITATMEQEDQVINQAISKYVLLILVFVLQGCLPDFLLCH